MRTGAGILAAVVALMACPAVAATYGELQAMVEGPWHHVPAPVSKQQFEQDQGRCRLIALQTPADSTTPAVVAILRWTAQVECMRALGYRSGPQPPKGAKFLGAPRDLQSAGGGVGVEACSEFTRIAGRPELEALFFSWAQGMITGWNTALINDEPTQTVEMAGVDLETQKKSLRAFCQENPQKRFISAVVSLIQVLRAARN